MARNSVQFDSCRGCGRSWEEIIPHYQTKEQTVDLIEDTGHLCHRCGERDLLIVLQTNAGKKPNMKKIDRHIKKKYGY